MAAALIPSGARVVMGLGVFQPPALLGAWAARARMRAVNNVTGSGHFSTAPPDCRRSRVSPKQRSYPSGGIGDNPCRIASMRGPGPVSAFQQAKHNFVPVL